jgi:hypothetical protein
MNVKGGYIYEDRQHNETHQMLFEKGNRREWEYKGGYELVPTTLHT